MGTFLRTFTFGHVRQLDAVVSRLLVNLAAQAPVLPGVDQLAYVDIDDTVKPTFGHVKQGAGRGYTGVRPGDPRRPTAQGSTDSAKDAHRFIADTLVTVRAAGATGVLVLRADSAFYQCDVLAAEAAHRRHAIVEQVIADLENGPMAHLPSGKF